MAASLSVGELANLRKTRRDEAAAAAQRRRHRLPQGQQPRRRPPGISWTSSPWPSATTLTSVSAVVTRTLLDVFAVAVHDDFAARFRWVCRCSIQVADDPSKFVGRMIVAPPEWFASVWQALRPVRHCRYPCPLNIACSHFNAWFDAAL